MKPTSPASADHQLRFDELERGFVYAISRRYVRDDDDAQDVAQEAMLLAYRNRASFRGESHPRTWLHRIAATTALGHLRRQKRRSAHVADADPEQLHGLHDAIAPSAEDVLVDRESADQLAGELLRLDEKYASVLRLRNADLREEEIAERLGISVAAVRVRAHRARGMLREALSAEPPRGRLPSRPG